MGPINEREGEIIHKSISFIDGLSIVAVQDEACSVAFMRLPDSTVAGRAKPAYTHVREVMQIAPDLLALISEGSRDARKSIQVLEYPDLSRGPWIVDGDSEGEEPPDERQANGLVQTEAAGPGAMTSKPLLSGGMEGVEFSKDGRFLFVEERYTKHRLALSVPPWGQRLKDMLMSSEPRSR